MRLHITALLAITAVAVAVVFLGAADDLQVLLTGLTEPHLDQHLLNMIEAHPPDPRIAPALEAEFDRRGTKSEKQAIAATLIRLGDSSDRLFRFLSLFVLRAVEDRTPFPVMFDSDGHEVRGRFSAEFENWCALNHKEPRSTAAEQLVTFMDDILMLAETNDWRADTLFRKGLESPNPMVVAPQYKAWRAFKILQPSRSSQMPAAGCQRGRSEQLPSSCRGTRVWTPTG